MATTPIRIAFVPEHYLLPLHLAARSSSFPFPVQLIPFPSGTGSMITALRSDPPEIDIAIGLTEGWVAGLLNPASQQTRAEGKDLGYRIVGRWVQNPLRWSIVTGSEREIDSVDDLGALVPSSQGLKVGVSRVGSGSHVMASVLAEERGWDIKPTTSSATGGMKPVVLGPFKDLRDGVNDKSADFFMWEHFTTKPFWTSTSAGGKRELKHVGEIYTPWPSWHVVCASAVKSDVLDGIFKGLDAGMKLFREGGEEQVVRMLGNGEAHCHYSPDDAREWMKVLEFAETTRGVDPKVMENVVEVLKGAGVIDRVVNITDGDGVVGIQK